MNEHTYLSKDHIGQTHSESFCNPDHSVFLVDRRTGARTRIIEEDGTICGFPGIEPCEPLSAEVYVDRIPPKVEFSTTFEKLENGLYRMIWTIRPDGTFWADSWGFGEEDYDSIELYACFNETGRFTAPFRLFRIGSREFASAAE